VANRFFIDLADGTEPVEFEPPDPGPPLRLDTVYFSRMLAEAERRAPVDGLTYYLTWSSARLPRTGDDVVAVVLSDEASRRPAYTDDVRAVFKTYGGRPRRTRRLRPTLLDTVVALQEARRIAEAAPEQAAVVARRLTGRAPKPVHPIPLGYWNQVGVDVPPIADRGVDVSFAGSVEEPRHGASLTGGLLESPKVVSRRQMLDALGEVERTRPDLNLDVKTIPSFGAVGREDATDYSTRLANTKVCLVPRGGSVETYRWFEAMRVGCVVIGEPMPPFWFYAGSPAIEVTDWRDLPSILDRVLGDEAELARRSAASRDWWDRKLSEEAVGAFVASRLGR
jgi:hypothetical protein